MAENVPKAVTPAALTPFGGDFDQLFNRMLRGWPFGWLEPIANGQPRALRAFEHAPKVEVQENGKSYTISRRAAGSRPEGREGPCRGRYADHLRRKARRTER